MLNSALEATGRSPFTNIWTVIQLRSASTGGALLHGAAVGADGNQKAWMSSGWNKTYSLNPAERVSTNTSQWIFH